MQRLPHDAQGSVLLYLDLASRSNVRATSRAMYELRPAGGALRVPVGREHALELCLARSRSEVLPFWGRRVERLALCVLGADLDEMHRFCRALGACGVDPRVVEISFEPQSTAPSPVEEALALASRTAKQGLWPLAHFELRSVAVPGHRDTPTPVIDAHTIKPRLAARLAWLDAALVLPRIAGRAKFSRLRNLVTSADPPKFPVLRNLVIRANHCILAHMRSDPRKCFPAVTEISGVFCASDLRGMDVSTLRSRCECEGGASTAYLAGPVPAPIGRCPVLDAKSIAETAGPSGAGLACAERFHLRAIPDATELAQVVCASTFSMPVCTALNCEGLSIASEGDPGLVLNALAQAAPRLRVLKIPAAYATALSSLPDAVRKLGLVLPYDGRMTPDQMLGAIRWCAGLLTSLRTEAPRRLVIDHQGKGLWPPVRAYAAAVAALFAGHPPPLLSVWLVDWCAWPTTVFGDEGPPHPVRTHRVLIRQLANSPARCAPADWMLDVTQIVLSPGQSDDIDVGSAVMLPGYFPNAHTILLCGRFQHHEEAVTRLCEAMGPRLRVLGYSDSYEQDDGHRDPNDVYASLRHCNRLVTGCDAASRLRQKVSPSCPWVGASRLK